METHETLAALRLLLEIETGENVTMVAYMYLLSQLIAPLGTLIFFTLLLGVIYRLVSRSMEMEICKEKIVEWRDALHIGISGYLNKTERQETFDAIDALVKDKVKEKEKENT